MRRLILSVPLLFAAAASMAVTVDWTPVGNPGNACDPLTSLCVGGVPYVYLVGTYEVTNAQYAEFLNAKAASDPYGLWVSTMGIPGGWGGITRSGSDGSYTYQVVPERADMPVTYVSIWDVLRFVNWMENGQGNGDTETGAYVLLGGTAFPSNHLSVTRRPSAAIVLTDRDEWHKAAYYNANTSIYYDYPAGSDTQPVCATPTATPNRANCQNAVGDFTIAGSYPGSASPSGTFDQGGNAKEWIEFQSFSVGFTTYRGIRGGFLANHPTEMASGYAEAQEQGYYDYRIGFRLAKVSTRSTRIGWKYLGNPGNVCDAQPQGCFGAVPGERTIAIDEVTNTQYAAFLNAVAVTDTNALYNPSMADVGLLGGITRIGSPGSYFYEPIDGREDLPVNHVSFYDALRFANWLHNGQPSGAQGNATTENGAYTITAQGIADNSIVRNPGAAIFVASEDEWYKAAYYQPATTSYFDYPTGSNTPTGCAAPTSVANQANCGNVVADLTSRGSYTGSASSPGTYDQGGNVSEWNESVFPSGGRGIRGGDFAGSSGDLAASSRSSLAATTESTNVGFRVAPEPGGIWQLVAGLLTVFGLARSPRARS
jgi:formylglycine-generating enzyme required for sulfatase activity